MILVLACELVEAQNLARAYMLPLAYMLLLALILVPAWILVLPMILVLACELALACMPIEKSLSVLADRELGRSYFLARQSSVSSCYNHVSRVEETIYDQSAERPKLPSETSIDDHLSFRHNLTTADMCSVSKRRVVRRR
jgi:hypothetical protein